MHRRYFVPTNTTPAFDGVCASAWIWLPFNTPMPLAVVFGYAQPVPAPKVRLTSYTLPFACGLIVPVNGQFVPLPVMLPAASTVIVTLSMPTVVPMFVALLPVNLPATAACVGVAS